MANRMGVFLITDKKYPTTNVNPGGWTNPTNAYTDNGVCANKNTVAVGGPYILILGGYGFALPQDAILDHINIDHKGVVQSAFAPNLQMNWHDSSAGDKFFVDNSSVDMAVASCAVAAYGGAVDILPGLRANHVEPSVDRINNETAWTTEIWATPDRPVAERFYCDVCYVEIVWHHECKRRNLIGVGR